MLPCCARLKARVSQEEAHLAQLARRASSPRNRSVTPDTIAAQKDTVTRTRVALVDHEADHAGVPV